MEVEVEFLTNELRRVKELLEKKVPKNNYIVKKKDEWMWKFIYEQECYRKREQESHWN